MAIEKYTVFGSSGFIGTHLVEFLQKNKNFVVTPNRKNILEYKNLGHVFYCIGMTSDFRQEPYKTIDAHVCVLKKIIENTNFKSFTYLSSTRIYGNLSNSHEEQALRVNPMNSSDLYNISKILGESACFSCDKNKIRVVRLSNVYGFDPESNNFLSAIIKDAIIKKEVKLRTSLESEKDYINIYDVVKILSKIATKGRYNIYNVASGLNTSNRQILKIIRGKVKYQMSVEKNALSIVYPEIDISRIRNEFGFRSRTLIEDLPNLINKYKLSIK